VKSARLYAPGDLRLLNEPAPIAGVGEKLIHVKVVGVCGSDLHWYREGGIGDARLDHPLIPGHEFSGVTESGLRMAVDPAIPCGKCELCLQGHPNLCEQVIFAGHGACDGALREYIPWDQNCLFTIPDTITDDDGAMLEPLGVAIHAVDLAHLKVGMTVGVFGCGPIGLLIIQLARVSGVRQVIATDLLDHRLSAAKTLGADQSFRVKGRLDVKFIPEVTGGRGVDVAFEVAGEQDAVDDAFEAVVPGGKVILAGIPREDCTSFTASTARRKGLTIKLVRRMKHTYPRAIDLVSKGQVDVRSLVTHHFPLEKAAEAFAVAESREGLKVIIQI
jgi:L-iditol 2-dehydrogenase